MAEHEAGVKSFRIDYACDSCGEGAMRSTGMVLASCPPQYPHRCNKCDAAQTFRVQYPRIEYRPEEV